jgi:hypothetical protein
MDKLSTLFAEIVAVSMAVERVVEILKGWLPNSKLFKPNPDSAAESRRCAWIHVLSGVIGAIIAAVSGVDIFTSMSLFPNSNAPAAQALGSNLASLLPWNHLASYACTGLLSSAGSAFWNHALDIIQATKVQQEQNAANAVASTAQSLSPGAALQPSTAMVTAPATSGGD